MEQNKSLKERAEEARLAQIERSKNFAEIRKKEKREGAIQYFKEHLPEARFREETDDFELDGDEFIYEEDGYSGPEILGFINMNYCLRPKEWQFHLSKIANLADYGWYLNKKEKSKPTCAN